MVVKRESDQSIDDRPTAGKSDERICCHQLSAFSDPLLKEWVSEGERSILRADS
jgi:hypothetical protein